jgi:hypothetical protein
VDQPFSSARAAWKRDVGGIIAHGSIRMDALSNGKRSNVNLASQLGHALV